MTSEKAMRAADDGAERLADAADDRRGEDRQEQLEVGEGAEGLVEAVEGTGDGREGGGEDRGDHDDALGANTN